MTGSDESRRQVAIMLTQRRVELDPEWKNRAAFGRATGVEYKTLQRIEGGRPHTFSSGTLLELDRAYRLAPGTIEALLEGRSAPPTPGAPTVPPGTRPPIEIDHEPNVRLRDAPPLRPGELLEGWLHPDGEWHWLFVAVVDGKPVTERAVALPGETPEAIAASLRAKALPRG